MNSIHEDNVTQDKSISAISASVSFENVVRVSNSEYVSIHRRKH